MAPTSEVDTHHDLIYDVGMHKGEDAHFYLAKGFRVVGFEADPQLAALCRGRFAEEMASGRLVIVEGAVVEHPERARATFYRNIDSSVWGTVYPELARRNERLGARSVPIEVSTVDFAACVERHGVPHYMKIDIEGADIVCLRALGRFGPRPDYVSIESHKVSIEGIRAELDLLERLGYDRFQAIQQAAVPRQRPPEPPREGSFAPYAFGLGASGLFGRELPDEWQIREQILRRYRRILLWYRLLGDDCLLRRCRPGRRLLRCVDRLAGRPVPGWYDTHARHSSVPSG